MLKLMETKEERLSSVIMESHLEKSVHFIACKMYDVSKTRQQPVRIPKRGYSKGDMYMYNTKGIVVIGNN